MLISTPAACLTELSVLQLERSDEVHVGSPSPLHPHPPHPHPPFTAWASHRIESAVSCFCFPTASGCYFRLSPRLCPSTAGRSPPSVSSFVFCLLLSWSRWFPPSLVCRLSIFCLVVLLISSLSLVATLCGVWSTYRPSFLLYVRPTSTFVSACILWCQLSLFFSWLSGHGILSCSFRSNIFLSISLWAVLGLFVICFLRDHVWQPSLIGPLLVL